MQGRRGFTLIELMIVVAIVGVLAVLATYGVRKYTANAKTAEARSVLGQIAKSAVIAYEREAGNTTVVNLGASGVNTQRALCLSSSMVPDSLAMVANRKYQSQQSDWRAGSANTGWSCLTFSIDAPQYFAYAYRGNNIDARTGIFQAQAYGDLNGDSVTSMFTLDGAVDNGQVHTAPSIAEVNPEE